MFWVSHISLWANKIAVFLYSPELLYFQKRKFFFFFLRFIKANRKKRVRLRTKKRFHRQFFFKKSSVVKKTAQFLNFLQYKVKNLGYSKPLFLGGKVKVKGRMINRYKSRLSFSFKVFQFRSKKRRKRILRKKYVNKFRRYFINICGAISLET